MVDETTPKSGENKVFLRKIDENGVVLKIFSDFGCKICHKFFSKGSDPSIMTYF